MKDSAKFLILAVLCAVLAVLGLTAATYGAEKEQDLIRFHVIANSDSLFDQSVKLIVRDEIIGEVNALLKGVDNADEAEAVLADHTEELLKTANAVLKQQGCDYEAQAALGPSLFPTKTYGNLTLPAGEYKAFRIILGEGAGKNWWCVLYPPLCFVDIKDDTAIAVTTTTEAPAVADETTFAADGTLFQIKLRSKLLEIFR